MRALAFETVAKLLANAKSDEEREEYRQKLRILVDRSEVRAASVIKELCNQQVELEEV